MKIKYFIILTLVVILISIVYWFFKKTNYIKTYQEQESIYSKQDKLTNSNQQKDIVVTTDYNLKEILAVIEKELPIWIKQWQKQLPNFDIKSFEKEKEEEMSVLSEYEYDTNAKNNSREKLYIFSPDKTKFLDIYLGMDFIEENGKTIAAFDADSGVNFIDIKNNKVKYLSMWGPSSGGCQDAIWLNNNIFVLLGYERNYLDETKEEILPFVRIYDLLKNKTIFYKCPQNIIKHPTESLPMSRIEYQKSKFPDIWRGITVE